MRSLVALSAIAAVICGVAGQQAIPPSFTNIAASLGLFVNGQPPPFQPQSLPQTFDPASSDPCYGVVAAASLNQGLCGSDFAQAAAVTMSINLCRASVQHPSGGVPFTATRVSPQYLMSISRYVSGNGASICSGGSVATGAFQPFVNLKTGLAVSTLRRAIPILSCNASDPLELCSGGCAPYQEALCTLDDPSEQGAREAIPDVAVTQCPSATAFSVTQCANSQGGWLDAASNALTVQSGQLGATYVSVGPAAGMNRGVTLSPSRGAEGYPLWTLPDVISMKAFLVTYGAATVAMSACLSWQAWQSGCRIPPHAIDGAAGLCLYREPLAGSRFNSTYGLYTLRLDPTLASQPYNGPSCPASSSLVSATLIGWKTVGGVESWIVRGNWGSGLGVGGDFFVPISATLDQGNGAVAANGSVAIHYPESLLFYPSSPPFPVSAQAAYPATLPVGYDAGLRAGVQALGYQPQTSYSGEAKDSDAVPFTGGYFDALKVEPALTATVVRAAFNAVGETQQTSALVLARVFKNDCRVVSGGYFCALAIDVLDLSTKAITRWSAGAVKRLILSDALSAVAGLGSTAGVTIVSLQASATPVTDLSALTAMGAIGDLGEPGQSLYTEGEKRGLTAGIVIVAVLASAVLVVAAIYTFRRWRVSYQEKKMEKQREQAMELVAAKASRYSDNAQDEDEVTATAPAAGGAADEGSKKKRGGGRAKGLHANVAAEASETDAAELLRVEKELASGGFLGILPTAGSNASAATASSASAAPASAPTTAARRTSKSELPGGSSAFDDDEEGDAAAAAADEQARKEQDPAYSGKFAIGGDDDDAAAGSSSAAAAAAPAPAGTVLLANPSSTTVRVTGENTLVYGKKQPASKRVI